MTDVVGASRHAVAVERLRASYAAIPAGAPVRLAKPTSNLFRTRSRARVPGLDVAGLTGVVSVDAAERTADVQGMCTYEDLVDVTLARGLVPLVVPQLRTITLGGAVSGLGIESTSFRSGLPHESVREMDVMCGDGAVRTVRPGDELFDAFPNSYGSLGYATRLRIALERAPAYVELRHVRCGSADALAALVAAVVDAGEHDGERVDAIDGVVFAPDEAYLTLARWADGPGGPSGSEGAPASDYTGPEPYYRSVQRLGSGGQRDRLTMLDYLWRWDTDWFWCSGAFGLHHRWVRALWPRRLRRSDVYHRLVRLENRVGLVARLDRRRGRPPRERVVQDVEVPVGRLAEFLAWFEETVGMRPVWVCPLRSTRDWPCYPLTPGETYVNVGFWGLAERAPGSRDGDLNRAVEAAVSRLQGHKSLYSDAYYDPDTFAALYDTAFADKVRASTDPTGRLTSLYDKAVARR